MAKSKTKKESVTQFRITYPLFVRLLEWAREEANDDVAVHKMLERLEALPENVLGGMDRYEDLVIGLSR